VQHPEPPLAGNRRACGPAPDPMCTKHEVGDHREREPADPDADEIPEVDGAGDRVGATSRVPQFTRAGNPTAPDHSENGIRIEPATVHYVGRGPWLAPGEHLGPWAPVQERWIPLGFGDLHNTPSGKLEITECRANLRIRKTGGMSYAGTATRPSSADDASRGLLGTTRTV
jgi:hypothetical protein